MYFFSVHRKFKFSDSLTVWKKTQEENDLFLEAHLKIITCTKKFTLFSLTTDTVRYILCFNQEIDSNLTTWISQSEHVKV